VGHDHEVLQVFFDDGQPRHDLCFEAIESPAQVVEGAPLCFNALAETPDLVIEKLHRFVTLLVEEPCKHPLQKVLLPVGLFKQVPFVLTFVELPRLLAWFARPSAPGPFPPRLQAIYDWARFFLGYGALHMNDIVHFPVAQALRSLEALSEDRYAREEAFDREKALKDYNTMIKVSTHTGIRMGIEQGRIVGREEGREEGRIAGREEGLEDGLKTGLEHGRRLASMALLQDLLQAKFGTLPEWVQQRLEAASVATLRQLSVVVLRASTLKEVFGAGSDAVSR